MNKTPTKTEIAAFEASVKSDLLWEVTEAHRTVLLAINIGQENYAQEATNLLAAAERARGGGCTVEDIAAAKALNTPEWCPCRRNASFTNVIIEFDDKCPQHGRNLEYALGND